MILALIGLNVVVSPLGFRALQEADGKRASAFLFVPYQVARGENGLGMLLAHFAHGGFLHLLFNMYALYSFGAPVLPRSARPSSSPSTSPPGSAPIWSSSRSTRATRATDAWGPVAACSAS